MTLSCTKAPKRTSEGMLIQTDREFSAMSVKEGMHKAFLFYMADSGILLRDNSFPLRSRQALASLFEKSTDTSFILTWEPIFEKLSGSRDLGFTIGTFTSKTKSTGQVSKGTYVTIWERQKDGSWKFVLDSGTQ